MYCVCTHTHSFHKGSPLKGTKLLPGFRLLTGANCLGHPASSPHTTSPASSRSLSPHDGCSTIELFRLLTNAMLSLASRFSDKIFPFLYFTPDYFLMIFLWVSIWMSLPPGSPPCCTQFTSELILLLCTPRLPCSLNAQGLVCALHSTEGAKDTGTLCFPAPGKTLQMIGAQYLFDDL